jgi:hypothetical protein
MLKTSSGAIPKSVRLTNKQLYAMAGNETTSAFFLPEEFIDNVVDNELLIQTLQTIKAKVICISSLTRGNVDFVLNDVKFNPKVMLHLILLEGRSQDNDYLVNGVQDKLCVEPSDSLWIQLPSESTTISLSRLLN